MWGGTEAVIQLKLKCVVMLLLAMWKSPFLCLNSFSQHFRESTSSHFTRHQDEQTAPLLKHLHGCAINTVWACNLPNYYHPNAARNRKRRDLIILKQIHCQCNFEIVFFLSKTYFRIFGCSQINTPHPHPTPFIDHMPLL